MGATADTREVLSAYSGDVIGEVPVSDAEGVERLLQSAHDLHKNQASCCLSISV